MYACNGRKERQKGKAVCVYVCIYIYVCICMSVPLDTMGSMPFSLFLPLWRPWGDPTAGLDELLELLQPWPSELAEEAPAKLGFGRLQRGDVRSFFYCIPSSYQNHFVTIPSSI